MSNTYSLGVRWTTWWGASVSCALVAACVSSQPDSTSSTRSQAVLLGAESEVKPLPAMPVEAATAAPAPAENPFVGADFYINPDYAEKVDSTPTDDPSMRARLDKVKRYPTALWVDTIAAIEHVPRWLDDVAKKSESSDKPLIPVFVVYDLPNRDCSAAASAGELAVEDGGEQRYRSEFIDPIAAHFAQHPDQRIVVILEPDSLPNLVTNTGIKKCALSAAIYKNSIAYAIANLSLPNVYVYVDAAHAGWLGWVRNRDGIVDVFDDVLTMAGGPDRIRGFATNVSNYNALTGDWGKELEPSTPTPNELSYVEALADTLEKKGITGKGFLVDTSRSGQPNSRTIWGSWCNVARAGLGERPQIAPRSLVDAYYWVKPPGDSDGTSDSSATRFDANCASEDAMAGAPEAGQWFPEHFLSMVENAAPPI